MTVLEKYLKKIFLLFIVPILNMRINFCSAALPEEAGAMLPPYCGKAFIALQCISETGKSLQWNKVHVP